MSWNSEFDDPLSLPNGDQALTLREAGEYIVTLPITETSKPNWQHAIRFLIEASETSVHMAEAFTCVQLALKTLPWSELLQIVPPTPDNLPMNVNPFPDTGSLPVNEVASRASLDEPGAIRPADVAAMIAFITTVRTLLANDAAPEVTLAAIRDALLKIGLHTTVGQLETIIASDLSQPSSTSESEQLASAAEAIMPPLEFPVHLLDTIQELSASARLAVIPQEPAPLQNR
jgi:hypothetical protein